MSAHHPKASMIGATSVSTPMVRNPNERRVNIAAAGLAQIEAIMETGKGFEEAYAEAWRREVKPRQASAHAERAPSPPMLELLSEELNETRKARMVEKLSGGEAFWGELRKLILCGKPVMHRIMGELVAEGRVVIRRSGRFTMVRLIGTKPTIHTPVNSRKSCGGNMRDKSCVIDGIRFPTQTAAAAHFDVSCQTAGRYAMRGTSAPQVRGSAPKCKRVAKALGEASRKPCTIDGVEYESQRAAVIALRASKRKIILWAATGKSEPRLARHANAAATASQAFDHARTRKNSQTPSSGAISQSGAQMGGL